jgi:glucose/arabinose dehydrogenase
VLANIGKRFVWLLSGCLVACSGGASSGSTPSNAAVATAVPSPVPTAAGVSGATPSPKPSGASATAPPPTQPTAPAATPSAAPTSAAPASIAVAPGFSVGVVAKLESPHGLAFLPNGDLIVGTGGATIGIVPRADANQGPAQTFATLPDSPAYGVAYAGASIYVATQSALWRIPYRTGDQRASSIVKIATYRQGPIAPHSDGDVHRSASVAVAGSFVYVGIGSSCNACTEVDPTRATVQRANLDGSGMTTYATHIRNPIALAVNPATGTVWAGGAGQDSLPITHPYEYFDSLTLHGAVADYGWPACEENRIAYTAGADCTNTVVPRIELPAYSTLMGAAFYPTTQTGAYAFPAAYRGGVFIAAHGSWHTVNGQMIPPRVAYVPLNGDAPAIPVNWSNASAQWSDFLSGFQNASDQRVGRAAGVAVGPNGSLFVTDDNGNIYRIRPKS